MPAMSLLVIAPTLYQPPLPMAFYIFMEWPEPQVALPLPLPVAMPPPFILPIINYVFITQLALQVGNVTPIFPIMLNGRQLREPVPVISSALPMILTPPL